MNFAEYRTLIVLFVTQCFAQCAAPMLVLVSGIIGAQIAPDLSLATLPLACMVIGTAMTTIPATVFMSRFGRKRGFLTGAGYAAGGALLAAWAVAIEHFGLFCLAALLIGSNNAFVQQFRFAVAESVPVDVIPRSLSILMLAGIVSAIIGPGLASRYAVTPGFPGYVGTFIAMAALLAVAFLIILLFYRDTQPKGLAAEEGTPRPFSEILRDTSLLLAIAAAVVGWSVMTLVMTATPVAMHEMDHHSLEDTAWVIQSHILAMYLPSLFSGYLINWFGVRRIIQGGVLLMAAVVLVGYGHPHLMHYWWAMVLLGVGWNFLFVGGTTLLAQTYRDNERFKVQALNDFLVFGLQALSSLGAGVLLATIGWNGVMIFSLPWLALLVVFYVLGRPTRQSATA